VSGQVELSPQDEGRHQMSRPTTLVTAAAMAAMFHVSPGSKAANRRNPRRGKGERWAVPADPQPDPSPNSPTIPSQGGEH
jgi:hypothetical protein